MQLPKKITPSSLVQAIVEIRFDSTIKTEDIASIFYPILSNEFPKISTSTVQVQNVIVPSCNFYNNTYSVAVSNNLVNFDVPGGYTTWDEYFKIIQRTLLNINSLGLSLTVNRIGVRYISVFDKIFDVNQILSNGFSGFHIHGWEEFVNVFNKTFVNNGIQIHLQVSSRAQYISNDGKVSVDGVYVDIDAVAELSCTSFDDLVMNKINMLHLEQKKLFFSIINPEYLKTLNPIYDTK